MRRAFAAALAPQIGFKSSAFLSPSGSFEESEVVELEFFSLLSASEPNLVVP
jgi:hypothetical protein